MRESGQRVTDERGLAAPLLLVHRHAINFTLIYGNDKYVTAVDEIEISHTAINGTVRSSALRTNERSWNGQVYA